MHTSAPDIGTKNTQNNLLFVRLILKKNVVSDATRDQTRPKFGVVMITARKLNKNNMLSSNCEN